MNLIFIVGVTLTLPFLKAGSKTLSQTQHCQRDANCPRHHECKSGVCKEVFWCTSDSMCDPGECCMIGDLSKVSGYCGKIPKAEEFCWINGGGIGACPCEASLVCMPDYDGTEFGTCKTKTEA